MLVGESGARLHEEVFLAGTRLSRRQELGVERSEELLSSALDGERLSAAPARTLEALASRWNADASDRDGIRSRVNTAIARRTVRQQSEVEENLAQRRTADLARVDEIFNRFRATLSSTLAAADEQRRASEGTLFQMPEEREQRERDLARVRTRLATLDEEQRAERAAVEHRYQNVRAHTFVAALVFALTPQDAAEMERIGA